jgi:hypothetical protein
LEEWLLDNIKMDEEKLPRILPKEGHGIGGADKSASVTGIPNQDSNRIPPKCK